MAAGFVDTQGFTRDGDFSADETRPLLCDPENNFQRSQPQSPLPKRQLAALCAIRLADPIAFTQIFPYVNEMMETFGVAEASRTGFYSGLVVCAGSFATICTLYPSAVL